ncbi:MULTISPECIES: hypothetical protein [Nocardia]|uniref:hypothetical protein n=1 Tax=Nocardia TaxID=1817 RepID=UPI002457818E|nr:MULTISPECIES: hypothetical protein [Nocardia]
MGEDKPDRPDKLTPAQREQYENRYIPGKLSRDEVPRPPDKWLEHSAFWRAEWVAGRAFERGADIVFGLPQAGWQAGVPHKADDGQQINVDRFLPGDESKGIPPQNLEIKKGGLNERDLVQMKGYLDKLKKGERVTYLMRESKIAELGPQARQLIESLKKAYPEQFVIKAASEKAFQRIFEAGYKAVQKEQAQQLQQNLGKLPAREANALAVEKIAKDYLLEIEKGQVLGQEIGIDQLRFVHEALRDMEQAQARIDLDQAKEDRKVLGLRFHESRDVEKFLEGRAEDKHLERAEAIDKITHELIDRERVELGKATAEIAQQIAEAREQGKALDLDQLRQQHLALGNTLGAVQRMETDLFKDIAKGVPEQEAQSWLKAMEIIQADRDHPTAKAIDGLAETVEREEKARKEAAAGVEQARRDAEQARITEQRRQEDLAKLPPHVANLLDVGQAKAPTAAVERAPDENTPRVQRGHEYGGQERSRGTERDR